MKKVLFVMGMAVMLSGCSGKKEDSGTQKETTENTAGKAEKKETDQEPSKVEDDKEGKKNDKMAVVTAKSGLTMRKKPSLKSKIIDLLPSNAVVEVLEKGDKVTIKNKASNWYKIRYEDQEGYAFGGYLRMGDRLQATSTSDVQTASEDNTNMEGSLQKALVIAKSGLTLRKKPSQSSVSLTNIPNKSEVAILEFGEKSLTIENKEGSWCKVRYKGDEGYIFSGFLNFSTGTISAKSGLTLRKEPNKQGDKITIIPTGKEVYILDEGAIEDEATGEIWYKVRYGSKEGYASGEFIDIMGC